MSRKLLNYLHRQLFRPIGDSRTAKIMQRAHSHTCSTPNPVEARSQIIDNLKLQIPLSFSPALVDSLHALGGDKDIGVTLFCLRLHAGQQ
jgi:hypothetical protein